MPQNIVDIITESQIFPIVEFLVVVFLVMITYWGIHHGRFGYVKPVVKMLVSMFLGSGGYIAGKMAVVALFATKLTPATVYGF